MKNNRTDKCRTCGNDPGEPFFTSLHNVINNNNPLGLVGCIIKIDTKIRQVAENGWIKKVPLPDTTIATVIYPNDAIEKINMNDIRNVSLFEKAIYDNIRTNVRH